MTDVILDLLNMMRVRSTAYIGKNLSSPWGVHIDEHPNLARFHIVVAGHTWVDLPGGGSPEKLNVGDIAIFPNGKAHSYFDEIGRETKTGSFPTGAENSYFHPLVHDSSDTHLLCGYFEMSNGTPPAITASLPDMLIGRASDTALSKKFSMLVGLISAELSEFSEQSLVVLNRMTEMLCIYTIQDWMDRTMDEDDHMMALADPKTKLVLDAIHNDPTRHWSVNNLAQLYGQSRTAFAARFKQATGMSPMNYVRRWRINLSCRMLEDNSLSIDEIAFKSGYADTNAFNRAFKREIGSSPGAYKRLARV
ncbi:AraC family transcriptional regulator [uncultured Litoreibacter sp.]|uniref:AraC family transcriptional regulator n=1 Tax=uncultured Litoreibacter sp. TaxID=1392394 RepID=UPI00260D2CF0|nr:AraC family transcriptional regulator [uncultured Litoreibacter sp.]